MIKHEKVSGLYKNKNGKNRGIYSYTSFELKTLAASLTTLSKQTYSYYYKELLAIVYRY